jgi:tRNASer (uridine44-2'-O)-methyltransferase
MLLWKNTYGPETIPPSSTFTPDEPPWYQWPRPPGGFSDLGCGNGLLTHILTSEGYTGHGIDLRARTSWAHYPPRTQSRLVVRALDPTEPPPPPPPPHQPTSSAAQDENAQTISTKHLLPAGCFLIGNHADELTPWIPLLATRFRSSGYLSIPCCAWSFDERFDRARDVPLCAVDSETLNLGGGGGGGGEEGNSPSSSYALYRVWLASLSLYCGWAIEIEALRIPSTRNWAIVGKCCSLRHFILLREELSDVGRKRVGSSEEASHNVEELIEAVRKRGQFKTRRPEGKAGDH